MVIMTDSSVEALVAEKLKAFRQMCTEFEDCFRYVQDVHGQRRLSTFSVEQVVRYLHALWICECKDRLLSVPRTVERYAGERCLRLLRAWQEEGDTAGVVAFLQHRLDGMPFADLTRQIQQLQQLHTAGEQETLRLRLRHGRSLLLNRGIHLLQALEAIFIPTEDALMEQVRASCERYGHTSPQIEEQLAALQTPLYACVPHPLLTRENILLMNRLGASSCAPEERRAWGVVQPRRSAEPWALLVIDGYRDLTSMRNPVRMSRLVSQRITASSS
jgi:hypothetical protein